MIWYASNKGEAASVWMHTEQGEVMIADCHSKVLTTEAQRLNAKLMAASPEMMDALRDLAKYIPDAHIALRDIQRRYGL
jgi:hypothetical protein